MLSFVTGWFGKAPPLNDANAKSLQALVSSLLTMAWFVEARDPYAGGHLWRVSRYARLLSEEAGLSPSDVARITLGGFLHDLGKIGIPDTVLCKTCELNVDEHAIIRTHPEMGLRMLAGHPLTNLVRDAIYSHHERPDGTGYPRGLKGSDIPLDARIVSISEAFDAMTSSRPYRMGMSRGQALAIIQSQSGCQFDPALCMHFLDLGRRGVLEHVMGHSDDCIPLQECPLCGPILVIKREQQPGEHIYCGKCSGEFSITEVNARLMAWPTGRTGSPSNLPPDVDHGLIRNLVAEVTNGLRLEQTPSAHGQALNRGVAE